ncbi:M57 family metalloprotease [Sorangium cellulosum]|uniref:M57 family metalloprotease n=1 Tax=Sorangium cellulosum TaxID=56 RepID=UPI0011DDAB4A|nr:M57 family metalloprotease [Sorangium cellulosum]
MLLGPLSLAGCYSPEGDTLEEDTADEELVATAGSRPLMSYEEFRKTLIWVPSEGVWVAEGDIPLRGEERIRQFYETHYTASGALTVYRLVSSDNIWSRANRLNLTYCVSASAFGTKYSAVVDAMNQAAAAWENAANVRFVHVVAEDSNCTNLNNNVKFNVTSPAPAGFHGWAMAPSTARSDNQLRLTWQAAWDTDTRALLGVVMHELGHTLGFDHEHINVPGSPCEDAASTSRQVTDYDSLSVMHYRHCQGSTNTTGAYFLSQRDIEGAQALYEAPTNVADTTISGTLYARKRSDGDIYKKSGSTWTKVSGPVQAFLTIGTTLYALGSSFGNVLKYSGSGTTWTTIGGSANQIFVCENALCATNSDGDVYKYSDSTNTWSNIAGPGASFESTAGSGPLYALSVDQGEVWRRLSGTWTNVGGAFADLFGAGSSMYGLTRDRQTLKKYSGSGTTWTTVGGAGRQWQGQSNGAFYALTPDAGAVYRYDGTGTSWSYVGGASARLYGTHDLYATEVNAEDIWVYDPGTNSWSYVGKP